MLPVETNTSARTAAPVDALRKPDPLAARRFGTMRALGRTPDPDDPAQARDAAALLTSQLFFAPLLAEMRKLPFGREFGHGGRTEEVFGEQLDMRIADTVARSDRGLTTQIAHRLTKGSKAVAAEALEARQAVWPTWMQTHPGDGGISS